jgi:hypothetical protein
MTMSSITSKLASLSFLFLCCLTPMTFGVPEGMLPDAVFNKNIKTVEFYKEGWEFAYPILEINDSKTLSFSFDDLDTKYKTYNYTIVHCEADWTPSRISPPDYLDGFYPNLLTQYEASASVHIPYYHYKLQIPNENVRLKISGNYVLLIYTESDDKPFIMKRFVVVDQRVTIEPQIRRPVLPIYQNNYQEVDFTINYSEYPIVDPLQSLKVVVVKNNQWKFSSTDFKPVFIHNAELVYNSEDKNLFLGGNEFRSFDTKSLKHIQANMQAIDYQGDSWKVTLRPDKARDAMGYYYNEDINGKFLIQNQEGTNPTTDAEYAHVLLTFAAPEALPDGDIYAYGGFADFNCYDDNRMKYNPDRGAYELDLLVKQGYYNYQYVYVPKKQKETVDERYFEGSYYETENDYVIYVYYRPFSSRYDKLIGVKVVNSLKRR